MDVDRGNFAVRLSLELGDCVKQNGGIQTALEGDNHIDRFLAGSNRQSVGGQLQLSGSIFKSCPDTRCNAADSFLFRRIIFRLRHIFRS